MTTTYQLIILGGGTIAAAYGIGMLSNLIRPDKDAGIIDQHEYQLLKGSSSPVCVEILGHRVALTYEAAEGTYKALARLHKDCGQEVFNWSEYPENATEQRIEEVSAYMLAEAWKSVNGGAK